MKTLSIWASHYKSQARIVIFISWVLLTFLGIYIGATLKELNTILPVSLFITSIVAFLTTFLVYPLNREWKLNKFLSFYAWRKSCDMVVAAASFIMVIYVSNNPAILFRGYQPAYAALVDRTFVPADSTRKLYKSVKDFSASMKDENGQFLKWRERKKLLKTQVRAIRKANDMSSGEKTALIVLSVLVAIDLLALVAGAACSLSCNGLDAGAILLGVGGTVLVVWLLIFVIRKINGKTKKKLVKAEAGEGRGE